MSDGISIQRVHPEDSAVPGKSLIKFASALQSFTVCLWDEGQHFMARMHLPQRWFIFLIHPSDKDPPETYNKKNLQA